jgi:hypothetical protein
MAAHSIDPMYSVRPLRPSRSFDYGDYPRYSMLVKCNVPNGSFHGLSPGWASFIMFIAEASGSHKGRQSFFFNMDKNQRKLSK